VGYLVHGTSFFLGGKTPQEIKEEIISKRKEQKASYF